MQKGWLAGVLLALLVGAVNAPEAWAHRKRADPCGCHHQYGLRHCHPTMKSEKCEAPVAGSTADSPVKKKKKDANGAEQPKTHQL